MVSHYFKFNFTILILILYGWGVESIIFASLQDNQATMLSGLIRAMFILMIAIYLTLTYQSIIILTANGDGEA